MPPIKRQPTVDELNSSFFHHTEKGCVLFIYGYRRGKIDKDSEFLIRQKCKTHEVTVCKCGWLIGYHFGYSIKPGTRFIAKDGKKNYNPR